MAGELNLKYSAINKTILTLILGQNRTMRYGHANAQDPLAMLPVESVPDNLWTDGMVTMAEQLTLDGTPTASYVADFPEAITIPGEYAVEYYLSTAALPGNRAIGVQDVYWNSTSLATIPSIDLYAISTDTSVGLILDGLGNFSGATVREKLDSIQQKTNNLPAAPSAVGDAMTLQSGERAAIAAIVWSAASRSLTTFGTLVNDVAAAVWGAATRTLTGFGTLITGIWTNTARTITGGTIDTYNGNTPQSGDAYARVGAPAGASVSADIAAVKTKTDKIPNEPAAVGSAMTLTTAERQAIAAALLDLANTIDGKTLRQALQIISAVLAGKVSGAGSGIETFRGLDDGNDRVVVTADPIGNRTNVTYS